MAEQSNSAAERSAHVTRGAARASGNILAEVAPGVFKLKPLVEAEREIERLRGERDRLRDALQAVLGACDQGRLVERGAGGMTLEAQMRRSVYNHVPAWPIEEARAALWEAGHE